MIAFTQFYTQSAWIYHPNYFFKIKSVNFVGILLHEGGSGKDMPYRQIPAGEVRHFQNGRYQSITYGIGTKTGRIDLVLTSELEALR